MKKILLSLLMTAVAVLTGRAGTLLFAQNGLGPDNVWSNTANWFTNGVAIGAVPTLSDDVGILGDTAWRPAVVTASGAVANSVKLGLYGHGGILTVDLAGTLTLDGYLRLGVTAPAAGRSNHLMNHGQTQTALDFRSELGENFIENTGTISTRNMVLSMSGGSTVFTNSGNMAVSKVLRLAQTGSTIFNMESGTVNVGTLDLVEDGTGRLNLHGGTITAAGADLDGNDRHTIDITEGKLIVGGDRKSGLDWMASIGRITAYGGTGTVVADYDSVANQTTLYGTIPEPVTLGLLAAVGGTLLFIRRRFMI